MPVTPLSLKEERERRGLSRAALARKADMNPSEISHIESGRHIPYDSQLLKIAAALGVEDVSLITRPLGGGGHE